MCGLAGIVNFDGGAPAILSERVSRMAAVLSHRGPDDDGNWADPDGFAAFGFRRLSIIDTSSAGHQPMFSADGRFALVFNGEAYNFQELSRELRQLGHNFRGHADSEVVLAACVQWGVEAATKRLNGMFAFALWDRRERRLWLVRDRMGVKPLYWARFGSVVLFGSELKALRADTGWTPELNCQAASAYLRHGYCPAPHTIYNGVRKLSAGHVLRIDSDSVDEQAFWSLAEAATRGLTNPTGLDAVEAEEHLDQLLRDAVSKRMIADVPIGAFLSGGIDSSTVVAMMQLVGGGARTRSFTIGFEDAAYDESKRARAIADHLGTDHGELVLNSADAIDLIPNLPEWYDEPFADSSQIPTALVSRFARQQVKVSLSGDGGDELFGGYERYFTGADLWRRIERVPALLRKPLAALIKSIPVPMWDRMLAMAPARLRPGSGGEALHWFALPLASSPVDLYRQMVSLWPDPVILIPDAEEAVGVAWGTLPDAAGADLRKLMPYLDAVTYLPDDILTKVDRASMAFGLEAREPLLDYRLVEFAWSLPLSMKMRGDTGKWLLRRVLGRYVPPALTDQPKRGFALPIGEWLRGPLREWAEELLEASKKSGFMNGAVVADCWSKHLAGAAGREGRLWAILMLQAWRQRWQI